MQKLNKLIIFLIPLIIASCCDCDKTKNEKPIITGKMNWSNWQVLAKWDDYSAKDYNPDQNKLEQLKQIINKNPQIKFKIFAGSWCYDSEIGVPKIYKLFKMIKLDESRIELYGVNRQKIEPSGEAQIFNIERVPTLIILFDKTEINRIIEYPKSSWEDDILELLRDLK